MDILVPDAQIPADKTVYIIAGPTAVGKTAIAIEVAKAINTSIISADSRQCYKEITIGTAKPTAEELSLVKHYFINEASIQENLTAADFESRSLDYLREIFRKSDYAVVSGGTGLYIKALTDGLDIMPQVDDIIEGEVNAEYEAKGLQWLQEEVEKEDPAFFTVGEVQNPGRLLRALIFKLSTGRSITEFRTNTRKRRPFKMIKVAIDLPRPELYNRINERVDNMIGQGLVEEAKSLHHLKHLKNLQTVGYSELFDYFDGTYSLEKAIDRIKQHTRNYAKRQITWFKKDQEYHWLRADDNGIIEKILALK